MGALPDNLPPALGISQNLVSKSYICPCDAQYMFYYTLDFMLIIIQWGADLVTSLWFGAMVYTSAYHAQIMLHKSNISSLAYVFYKHH